MTNHPNRSLLRARNALPGDTVCTLLRDVETSIGSLPAGTEVTPLSAGMNNITGRYERVWLLSGGRKAVCSD